MAVETKVRPHAAQTSVRLRIEFLFLDLTTCTRCLGADRGIEAALDIVGEVLQATGVEVEVDKILVGSAKQARALPFVSSPTVRVDGHDVALELRGSLCGSEARGGGDAASVGDAVTSTRPPRSLRLPRDDARGAGTVTLYPPACALRRPVLGRSE